MTPTQLEIDISAPAPAQRSSDTSVAAGKSMEPAILSRLEMVVMGWFHTYPEGTTCDHIEELSKLSHQTASARIRRLAQLGRIVDSGERRKTRSGRNAVVWKVSP